ncbi:hypothetical protein OG921_04745 [Aldersonia sp. NBC_00410]|uniref:hypothetical protein n=1 Tax=Aldersonia sp. NBC_00410 TaxID=2975954 RepID=UPI00225B2CA2|nr:hypothetical protein [Aldersonia sp. NBC_00410]MCX5042480.1 hypothetical protein [Aldersonia sp. NBC_00410]
MQPPKDSQSDAKAASRPDAMVMHTTARISGDHAGLVSVEFARTNEAVVTMVWGGILMRFLSANAAQGVLEGFSAARGHLAPLAAHTPNPRLDNANEFVQTTLALNWVRRASYAVVGRNGYSTALGRTVHWIDLSMGPVTWLIMDRTAYHSALDILRRAHRTAAGVCLDGDTYGVDPTEDDYIPPLGVPEANRRLRPGSARI